jgi:glucose dehydrogenase
MTPQVHEGLVIVGSSGGEWPLRGFVAAFDAHTGKERWRWHSTDPNSFAGDSWRTGGGMVWNTPAIDPERGLAIFAAGNPNPDFEGESRRGDNLYTDSIVALDVKTGTLKWHYQEVKHDLWDYDPASNVVLFDVESDGKKIPAAGQAGKVGWLFIVNRTNGELMFKSEPFVKMSDTMFATPTQRGVTVMPGANGGANWSPPAYSPDTNLVYVLGINQPMKFTTGKPVTAPGQVRLGSSWSHVEGGPETGVLSAIDVNNGKIAWQYETP